MKPKVMKTYSVRAKEIERRWHVVDATGQTLGRLSSRIAQLLLGKHKVTFSPHLNVGDPVVVVNAAKIRTTGNKLQQKLYRWHTGWPGGFRERTLAQMLQEHPERVLQRAVTGMLPHNPLGRQRQKMLRVYPGPEHPHEAQVKAGIVPAISIPPRKPSAPKAEPPETPAARPRRPARRPVRALAQRGRNPSRTAAPRSSPSESPTRRRKGGRSEGQP